MTVNGYLRHAWSDADGKPIEFYLRSLKGADPKLNLDLFGSWRGPELVVEDKGNWALSFTPDGHAKGYLHGTNSPAENTRGSLHYGIESEFNSACKNGSGASF